MSATQRRSSGVTSFGVAAIVSVLGCEGGSSVDAPAGDPGCIRANAIQGANWPNGPGYCLGNTFVACDGNTAFPTDCGKPCVERSVPRTILVGCNLEEPNTQCAVATSTFTVCDGVDLLVCDGGKLFSRRAGICQTPPP